MSGIQCMFVPGSTAAPLKIWKLHRVPLKTTLGNVEPELVVRSIDWYGMIALHPRFVFDCQCRRGVFIFVLLTALCQFLSIMSSFVVNKGGNNNFIPNWNL